MNFLNVVMTFLFFLLVVEGSQKFTQRHMEIIDSLAALPPRKKVKGVSLELDAQNKFQEEGLAAVKGATIRKYLRASAVKQGISNRNKVVTESHREIMKELATGNFSGNDLFQIASKRFEEAGLDKICSMTFRTHLKYQEGNSFNLGKNCYKFTQAHAEIIDSVAKGQASSKVVGEIFRRRGLKDIGRTTNWIYNKLARERLGNAAQETSHSISCGEEQVVKNPSFENEEEALAGESPQSEIFTAAHGEVLRNLACSSSDKTEDLFKLASEECRRRDLVPLCYSSFLGHYCGSASRPVEEKNVIFSNDHREIMLECVDRQVITGDERDRKLKVLSDMKKDDAAAVNDAVEGLLLLTGRRV